MTIFLITALALASATAVLALLAAGYLYGQQQITRKMLVEAKRRERRQARELAKWHDKLSEKAGLGPLYRKVFKESSDDKKPKMQVVSPSRAVNELKKQNGVPQAANPPGFLEQAGIAA